MSRELSLAFADDGIAIGSYGPIAVTVLIEPSTIPRLAALRRHLDRFVRKWPDGTFSLTVLGPGSLIAAVPSEIREESTAIARDFPSLGSTIVVEGEGFTGAAIRAFLSGLFLIARNRSQIHRSVGEAADWLSQRIATQSAYRSLALGAIEIAEATERARAAVGKRAH